MRDLLPGDAIRRRELAQRLLDRFALHGYALVNTPAFEFASVLERGLGTLDPKDVLRFVEPESGEVAALGPDMTPQVARMIATRLRNRHTPYRLCYEGTVLRRRSGRARKHRQIPQVGIELAGAPGLLGDIEVLTLAIEGFRAAGLTELTIDLGEASIVRSLLDGAADDVVARVSCALAKKDELELEACAREEGTPAVLGELVRLHGGREVFAQARRLLANGPGEAGLLRLAKLFDAACARGLERHLTVDLGEAKGFEYYTGPVFHVYAPGPGEALGAGGRYDDLLARFGAPMPAVGFAYDLDSVAWALRDAKVASKTPPHVVMVTPTHAELAKLREHGIIAVEAADRENAMKYASDWGYRFVVQGSIVFDVEHGSQVDSTDVVADVLRANA
ncbi:MAG: ATP phosphoribosyltransferase regulatory subunit [Polyangiaceae bacterium]